MADLFEPFPKLARLSRECVVTEKIDGTNTQVIVDLLTGETMQDYEERLGSVPLAYVGDGLGLLAVWAGSRTRIITPGKTTDNFGFAAWVQENVMDLALLGPGRHYGEWYGKGIQRGYGLDHKRFALFNASRWQNNRYQNSMILKEGEQFAPACCDVVPVLWRGSFDTFFDLDVMGELIEHGSYVSNEWFQPEGIVVYHTAARVSFKKTFEHDHSGKEAA